jgi:PKD repeat protein
MAEEKPQGIKSAVSGWVKGLITSIFGLATGAILMYLTPLVNNAIKPGKPVANFATQVAGQTVQVNNRSTGGTQGWWDFGDGTALEPFDPQAETITHNYAKAGAYQIRLTLQNLLGEESERASPVTVEATSPEIASFELTPLTPDEAAPATYLLKTKVKNAQYCILSQGDEKPLEVEDAAGQQRYVTFNDMGTYTVRVAAVNGKQLVEKAKTVYVAAGMGLTPMAKLKVSYEAVQVTRFERKMPITCEWPAGSKESVVAIRKERPAYSGFKIVSAELVNKAEKNAPVRNVKVEVSPERDRLILTGDFARPTGLLAPKSPPPNWIADVKVTMEKRSAPVQIVRDPIMMSVSVNTPTKVPFQPVDDGWEITRKQMSLELWDPKVKVWEGTQAVSNAKVVLKNQTCLLTAIPQNDGVLVKIDGPSVTGVPPLTPHAVTAPVGPVIRPASFEINPLLKLRPMKNVN